MSDAALGTERFILTLVFSALVHGVLLLGVGFAAPQPPPAMPSLDVILVSTATRDAPEQADFLANASQAGGGDLEDKARPTAPASAPVLRPEPGDDEMPRPVGAPRPTPEQPAAIVATRAERDRRIDRAQAPPTPATPLPQADEAQQRLTELAQLAAERDAIAQAYARRPRRKFISAQTREYAWATYMRAWVARVERVGNLNYPPEARQQQIHGDLILTVAINRDGSIDSIDIVKPSGFRVLDDAAVQIVRMSAPFNPLPADERERVDILHITRTWQFLPGDVLRHR